MSNDSTTYPRKDCAMCASRPYGLMGPSSNTMSSEQARAWDTKNAHTELSYSLDADAPLVWLAGAARNLDRATRAAVAEERAQGTTWQAIGDMLHITKQAAQQRYGAKAEKVSA